MLTHKYLLSLCFFAVFVAFSCHPLPVMGATGTTTVRSTDEVRGDVRASSSIPIPVLFGVLYDDIIPDFGDPRGGGTRSHEGQDILAPKGTPIVSPTRATVLDFGTEPTAGKYVYTRGSNGRVYAYIHLDEIAKIKKGQKLKVGDMIGTVGDTGNAQGVTPHLHFEIRAHDTPVDPYPYLTGEFTLREKITFLNRGLRTFKKPDRVATFMVNEFRTVLLRAEHTGMKLDARITKALKKNPAPVLSSTTPTLRLGSEGTEVVALQLALAVLETGDVAKKLLSTGATGYFGKLTASALREYQEAHGIPPTGVLDQYTNTHIQGELRGHDS